MTRPAALVPAPLPDFDPAAVVDLDVRDDLRAGREPLARILATAESLPQGGVLHLRSPFQPTPLFTALARLGYAFHTESFADDDWSSWFWQGTPALAGPIATTPEPFDSDGTWDLRHCPAPEPLRLILDRIATETLAFDVLLPAYPELLPGLLAGRGWTVTVVAPSSGGVKVRLSPTV
jgi:hypothetical protein